MRVCLCQYFCDEHFRAKLTMSVWIFFHISCDDDVIYSSGSSGGNHYRGRAASRHHRRFHLHLLQVLQVLQML